LWGYTQWLLRVLPGGGDKSGAAPHTSPFELPHIGELLQIFQLWHGPERRDRS
jgi:hypothetical protein